LNSDAGALAQHEGMVYRFALFLTQDPQAAEEVTQETFRIALTKGTDPAKGTNYGAWLRTIAKNVLRNYRRSQRSNWLIFNSEIVELAEARFVASGSDRDDAWEARRRALRTCIEKLPAPDQELLLRRYETGEKVKTIAARLGKEPNSLSKRLERIREALRHCIDSTLEGVARG